MPPWLVIPRGLSTLYRAYTISSNHWVCLDSLGSKGLLQPTFGATLARAIRTLIEYVIFRTLNSGSDSNVDDQYSKLKRFIVQDLTDWANENHTFMQIIHKWCSWILMLLMAKLNISWYQKKQNVTQHQSNGVIWICLVKGEWIPALNFFKGLVGRVIYIFTHPPSLQSSGNGLTIGILDHPDSLIILLYFSSNTLPSFWAIHSVIKMIQVDSKSGELVLSCQDGQQY